MVCIPNAYQCSQVRRVLTHQPQGLGRVEIPVTKVSYCCTVHTERLIRLPRKKMNGSSLRSPDLFLGGNTQPPHQRQKGQCTQTVAHQGGFQPSPANRLFGDQNREFYFGRRKRHTRENMHARRERREPCRQPAHHISVGR